MGPGDRANDALCRQTGQGDAITSGSLGRVQGRVGAVDQRLRVLNCLYGRVFGTVKDRNTN